jgi:signal transduction histidine kinase
MSDHDLLQTSIRILLIEDSPLDADLFQSYLALSHLAMPEVTVAERLTQALEAVQEEEYDVIFLDYKLPDSEGADSLSRLKSQVPYVPIVMLTGLDDDHVGLEMVKRGAQDYLVKDRVNESILWRVLRYAIARKRTEAQQREFEERLRAAQRSESLARLAGGIAHTYNNLLTSIMGNASLALGNVPNNDPGHGFLREIQKAAKRAALLTNQMLTYSGHCRGVMTPLDLGRFVERMAPFLRTVREGSGAITYRMADGVVVRGDVGQLQQLVVNLVENAQEAVAEAKREDGTVAVAVERVEFSATQDFRGPGEHERLAPGSYACLSVADTGTGMDDETLLKAFDPFFSTKFTGRGLGLASVLGVVRGHHGALRVASEPGQGTTISIYLPFAADADLVSEEDEGTVGVVSGRGLMVVADEEALVASVARKILERYGFTVLPAANLAEIKELVVERREEMTCVLIDCGLLKDPLAFVFELREKAPKVGILLTSDGDESPMDLSVFDGAVQYLRKPYLPRELMRQVQATGGA